MLWVVFKEDYVSFFFKWKRLMCFGIICYFVVQQENFNVIIGLKIYILDINFLLIEYESCFWDYWFQVVVVYSEFCELRIKSDGGLVFFSIV